MMHFPLFQIPLYFRKIFRLWKIFKILPFPEKFPPKFLMTIFLVIDHKFRISPFFSCFSTFPPCFAKIIISPLLLKISVPHLKFLGDRLPQSLPVLQKFTCFLHTLCVFRFPPYFDHDAFMHHPMHVLDAPDNDHSRPRSGISRACAHIVQVKIFPRAHCYNTQCTVAACLLPFAAVRGGNHRKS